MQQKMMITAAYYIPMELFEKYPIFCLIHAMCTSIHSEHISPVAKPQNFEEPCNTVHTKIFCCFHTSEVCFLGI